MYNSFNVLNATELYTLKYFLLCSVNFTSIKKNKKVSKKKVEFGNPGLGMIMVPVKRALGKRSGHRSGRVRGSQMGSPGLAREFGELWASGPQSWEMEYQWDADGPQHSAR